jgi:TetR/AcrR family transcriptional regulator, transcriptional repressor for nem operon
MTFVMFGTLMAFVIKRVKGVGKNEESWMRVSKAKAAHNRRKILAAAARLFRERGIGATGVDAITAVAGLTHGAVYSQFGSKEAIAAEAISGALTGSEHVWQRLAEREGRQQAFPAIVAQYLSRDHRDYAGRGCVLAALGSEIGRQPNSVREAFTEVLKDALKFLAATMPKHRSSRGYDDAIAAFVAMAGALILARAVNDETLSRRILKTTAKRVIDSSHLKRGARCSPRSRTKAS